MRLLKAVERTGDKEQVRQKEALIRAYRNKEQKLNQKLSAFLKTRYGHSGDPPPKAKPQDLIMNLKKTRKKIDDGRSKEDTHLLKEEPVLSKLDLKYMSLDSQMQRFTKYLNHSFYLGADAFLKAKHSLFVR